MRLLPSNRSPWILQFRGDFHDPETGYDFDVYFAFKPLKPFEPKRNRDPWLHEVKAWQQVAILCRFLNGVFQKRFVHSNTSWDLDELLRAQLQGFKDVSTGLEKGLFLVAGEFRKLPTEYYEGDLNHPPDFQDAIDKAKALQPREEPPNIL